MKNRRRSDGDKTNELIIRRPLLGTFFLLIMCLITLCLCFWDVSLIEPKDSIDYITVTFYSITELSIWLLITVILFVLLLMNLYFYYRYKVVIHEKSFSVTPLFGEVQEVPYSSIEKVTYVKWSKKGSYIEISSRNKTFHIPYTVNRNEEFKQTGNDALLRKFRDYGISVVEDYTFNLKRGRGSSDDGRDV